MVVLILYGWINAVKHMSLGHQCITVDTFNSPFHSPSSYISKQLALVREMGLQNSSDFSVWQVAG